MLKMGHDQTVQAVRTVKAIMTATYWGKGLRIIEYEQAGAARAVDALIMRIGVKRND